MVNFRLLAIQIEHTLEQPYILLQEVKTNLCVPIWVTSDAARTLQIAVSGYMTPNPMVTDLLEEIFDFTEIEIVGFVLTEIDNGVFKGQLEGIGPKGEPLAFACRPTDGIAYALKFALPMSMAQEIIDEIGLELALDHGSSDNLDDGPDEYRFVSEPVENPDIDIEKFKEFLNTVKPEDFDPS